MNILVDTCVWSLALRRRNKAGLSLDEQHAVADLTAAIQHGDAMLIGPIRQEILSGIRDQAQFARIKIALDPFPDEEIAPADYLEAARLDHLCRHRGVQCGPIDMLICAVAVRRRCKILTSDRALLRCIHVLQGEKLLTL